MAVSFNGIGTNLRVPFAYIEFDNSRAQQGPSVQPYKTLIMGQKISAGSATALQLSTVTSESQAIELYGVGSMLHLMIAKYLENDKITEIKAISIDDAGAAVVATGKVTIAAGSATKDGVLAFHIAGKKVSVAVSLGDNQDAAILALVNAINANTALPVTAAVNGTNANECDITAKNLGAVGNEIDIRKNYFEADKDVAGLAVTITAMASGATNPDVAAIIAALPEDQYNVIVNPWTDAANLAAMETELSDRFGALRQNDGVMFSAKLGSLGTLQTLGNSRNSQHSSIMGPASGAPNTSYEFAAAYAAQVAISGQADPARPFQTLPMKGILAPSDAESFLLTERNLLLHDGIATAKNTSGDVVRIERAITTFQTNAAGAADTSYLDVNTLLTLSFLRYDFRNTMLAKFPRAKLANDGTNFGPGQAIITPLVGRAVAVEKFRQWEDLGLVEGLEQFKTDLIVERNAQDPNRLDFLLPPDLINQMRVAAAQIQFLL